MTNIAKTEENSKLRALKKYLKDRFELRQCELTGYLYTKERKKKDAEWKQHERIQTLLDDVRENVTYQTYRGLGSNYSKEYVEDVLLSENVSPLYHPIKNYFEALEAPNSLDKVFDEIMDYLVLEDDTKEERKFVKNAIKKWAVGAVRSIYDDDYVPKQMLLMRSLDESVGKSSFFNSLTPKELRRFRCSFKDFSITSKDALINLSCNFIGHFEEIDQLFTYKPNRINFKSFATEQSVNVRRPYGRANVYRDRITSFVGTCNNYEFMSKNVGKSRFIVINVEALINKKYIKEKGLIGQTPAENFDANKLWASAYKLYKQGYDSYFTLAEEKDIYDRNAQHEFADPLSELLLDNFEHSLSGEGEFMSTTEIQKVLQEIDQNMYITPAVMGQKLTSNGFKKRQKKVGNRNKKGYFVKKIQQDTGWVEPTKTTTKQVKLL